MFVIEFMVGYAAKPLVLEFGTSFLDDRRLYFILHTLFVYIVAFIQIMRQS